MIRILPLLLLAACTMAPGPNTTDVKVDDRVIRVRVDPKLQTAEAMQIEPLIQNDDPITAKRLYSRAVEQATGCTVVDYERIAAITIEHHLAYDCPK